MYAGRGWTVGIHPSLGTKTLNSSTSNFEHDGRGQQEGMSHEVASNKVYRVTWLGLAYFRSIIHISG